MNVWNALPLYKKVLVCLLLAIGLYGVLRSDRIQQAGGSRDMRNRVVGARLMHDGISPFYYQWYPGAPLRYVIERDIDTNHYRRVSPVTSSPVFHRLLIPVSGYDEPVIDRSIYILFYVLLAIMMLIVIKESKDLLLTLLFFIPFLFSDGWNFHILMGQVYFLFGFLLFLISLCLIRRQYLAAGLLLALLVLLRPNCLVFIAPFFLMWRRYRPFILGFFAGLAVYGLFVLSSPFEQENWRDYIASLRDYTRIHLAFLDPKPDAPKPSSVNIEPLLPRVFEGEDIEAMKRMKEQTPETRVNHGPSNFFMIYKFVFHKAPGALLLHILLAGSYLIVLGGLLWKRQQQAQQGWATEPLIFSGLLLYSLSCFFSPIITFPYQMPQWMTAGALMLICHRKIPRTLIGLFLLGLLLNLVYLPEINGLHTLTDMLFCATLLGVILLGRWERATEVS